MFLRLRLLFHSISLQFVVLLHFAIMFMIRFVTQFQWFEDLFSNAILLSVENLLKVLITIVCRANFGSRKPPYQSCIFDICKLLLRIYLSNWYLMKLLVHTGFGNFSYPLLFWLLSFVNMNFEVVQIRKNLFFGLSCIFLHICSLCVKQYGAHKMFDTSYLWTWI